MADDKLPAIQFYPGDWKKDPGVQALDYETRGIWFEMLLIMHESDDRGKLTLNGGPMPISALARLLGLDQAKVEQTLSKLISYGVAKQEQGTGIIYNRRMFVDNELRKKRASAGSEGGKQSASKRAANRNQKSTPSSSSSSTATPSGRRGDAASAPPPAAPPPPAPQGMTPDPEVEDTVRRFGEWKRPGDDQKAEGVRELLALGISHDGIREAAKLNKPADVGFWGIVKALKMAQRRNPSAPKPTLPVGIEPPEPTRVNGNPTGHIPPVLKEPREVSVARRDAALKRVEKAMAKMSEEAKGLLYERVSADAIAAKIPEGPIRESWIKSKALSEVAKEHGIEGL